VELKFRVRAVRATDILDRERLEINGDSLAVTIPAGIFRIIDIEHSTSETAEEDNHN
jgi:hypothetical protein